MKEKLKNMLITVAQFLFNPRFLLCFGIAWMITNGWSYIMLGIGIFWEIGWMIAVASAYLTLMWLPISPEKIVTVAISIALMKLLFPKDEKTLGKLVDLYEKAKAAIKKRKKNSQ